MWYFLTLLLGKIISSLSRAMRLGDGSTWPGEVVLRLHPSFLRCAFGNIDEGIVLVAGTNGKTTTAGIIRHVLGFLSLEDARCVVFNDSGANLLNGLASAFIRRTSLFFPFRHFRFAVLEVDENTLPHAISAVTRSFSEKTSHPRFVVVLLNLFRDQLDRYGEVDSIGKLWETALRSLDHRGVVVANADDAHIVHISLTANAQRVYFGICDSKKFQRFSEHAADSMLCFRCGSALTYEGIYFSHLGVWRCSSCGFCQPRITVSGWVSPLDGLYNEYNTLASVACLQAFGIAERDIRCHLSSYSPAFGRQETLVYRERNVQIFLSKNPAGFNASLRAVLSFQPSVILFVLHDRIPDGRDVSWIWDVDVEMMPDDLLVIASGDRAYDMGLRVKYARKTQSNRSHLSIIERLDTALHTGVASLARNETLYVIPTYSAMLEVRKILTGRKIL